ncbi:unnamed protein product [Adineta ricciae]|uniref:Uncharacterized protein n=1 Tax=Adineta ricciae TaxID=249248 RepID=A0A815K025_ADIRI|nr:unnamed protein product [Adineta ricciae]
MPKILPCKVVSVRSSSNNDLLYQLYTLRGVLSISYGVQDLLDLTKCDFADLRAVEPTTLPTMTFIQACKEYISVGALNLAEACNCSGKCATKACPSTSLYQKVINYNLFVLKDNEYDDNDNNENPTIILRHQKYKTWLYIILFTICFYILFYINLIKTQSTTVTIPDISFDKYTKLYSHYNQTLSCPCSTIAVPYQNFTSFHIQIHSVCSSIFVDSEWIRALYFKEASQYGVWDFRTTAYSQFNLLSKFCLFSKEIIDQIQIDIANSELITFHLLSHEQFQIQTNGTIEYLKNNAASGMITFLNYIRNTSDKHYFVSALNTNFIIEVMGNTNDRALFIGHEIEYPTNDTSGPTCNHNILIIDATLNPLPYQSIYYSRRYQMFPMPNSSIVNGFFTGCTPLEALLKSTLDCLYEIECLQVLLEYFPKLTEINFDPENSTLFSEDRNISVNEYLNNLFITNWSLSINYTKYFHLCSPTKCTYSKIERTELLYVITFFISLYGGLVLILRLIASFSIDIIFKWKCFSKKSHENFKINQRNNKFKFTQTIKRLNLFKNVNNRTEQNIEKQKMITRVYLFLLISSICTICLYTSFDSESMIITITKLSMETYSSLEMLYSDSLQCPCSNQAISHKKFLYLSPRFHQICSSLFIDTQWINILRNRRKFYFANDWRTQAFLHFQFLSDFCHLAHKTIDEAIIRYYSQLFIVSSVMNETEFNKQINISLNQFYQSTIYHFDLMTNVLQLLMQIDQFYLESSKVLYGRIDDVNLISDVITADENSIHPVKLHFVLNEIPLVNSTMIKCNCAINPYCETVAVVFNTGFNIHKDRMQYVPGSNRRCLAIDSLLSSSLQCLYKESDCFSFLLSSFYEMFANDADRNPSLLFDFGPLNYDPMTTRFSLYENVSVIFKEIMIEQWNPSISYRLFYESCSPTYCTYSRKMQKQNFLGVVITLISMVGGVILSLRIVTPHLVELILKLLTKFKNNNQQQQQRDQIHQNCFNRMKIIIQNALRILLTTLIELNIFSLRDFGRNINKLTAKKYGRWATRLYFILFLSSLTILIFYTIIQPRSITKTFKQPLIISYYEKLRKIYGDELKCSCSRIASTYNKFIKIIPMFHPICSSEFVSKEWIINITNGISSNFSVYSQNDYRRFLSSHLQYLQGLCQLSNKSVTNTINEFLTSLFVTVEILPEEDFYHRIEILIEQSKSNVPILFSRFLFMIQTINHGNAFISTYETNYQYISLLPIDDLSYAYTESMIYDDNCSCGLYSNCTTQASFIEKNSSKTIPIQGLKMGCLPSESFHFSTLECFYNQSCLKLLYHYTNYENSSNPLLIISDDFPLNMTINQLINYSFTGKWLIQPNYLSYYYQCLPSICSYTYIEKFNLLYIITLFLSLQGGLTLVLTWISPKIIRILSKIYHYYRKKQRILVHPDNSLAIQSNNMNVQTSESIIISSIRRSSKKIFVTISLVLLLIGSIIFSIYYVRNVSVLNKTTDTNLNITPSNPQQLFITTSLRSTTYTFHLISAFKQAIHFIPFENEL